MYKHFLLLFKSTISLLLTIFITSCNPVNNEIKFGIISDVHQDLQKNAKERLTSFIDRAEKENPDFIIQLGDLAHGSTTDYILDVWNKFSGKSFHVLGNHDSDNIPKDSVIKKQGMPSKYYSYDIKGVHFVVLDLNYILTGNEYNDFGLGNNYRVQKENKNLISPEQLQWLEDDLAKTNKPTIIFSHQGLGDLWEGHVCPNREKVRKVFAKANSGKHKKVIACFAGDQHVDSHEIIDGIHYFQINSASYFWIDESAVYSNGHMAEYKDPIFAFVTIDISNKSIEINGTTSEFLPPAPNAENYKFINKAYPGIRDLKVYF